MIAQVRIELAVPIPVEKKEAQINSWPCYGKQHTPEGAKHLSAEREMRDGIDQAARRRPSSPDLGLGSLSIILLFILSLTTGVMTLLPGGHVRLWNQILSGGQHESTRSWCLQYASPLRWPWSR
jgi:hypothetical protein